MAFCLAASCARALLPVRGARAGALREGGAPGAGRAGRRRPGPRMTMAVARGGSRAGGVGAGGAAPFWGVFGVTAMLLNAVRRCAPVALEPFSAAEPLTAALVCAYGAAAASMAYAEGYKAFHLKFSPMVVKRAIDRSGRSNFATMHRNPPKFNPRAVNGLGAMEFAGGEVLKTLPFAQPLQQPITLVVVARARGDTTMVDSLTPQCAAARPRTSARAAQFCAILRNSARGSSVGSSVAH